MDFPNLDFVSSGDFLVANIDNRALFRVDIPRLKELCVLSGIEIVNIIPGANSGQICARKV